MISGKAQTPLHSRGMATAHGRGAGFEFWTKRLGNGLCSGDGKTYKVVTHRKERRAAARHVADDLGEERRRRAPRRRGPWKFWERVAQARLERDGEARTFMREPEVLEAFRYQAWLYEHR